MTAAESTGVGAGSKTPLHFWIVGVLALLWNFMGAFDYLATQLELDFYMSHFSEEQLAHFYGFPKWAVSAWAFAVWGALAGSIGLLLRRRWSVWAFGISLAGLVLTSIYNLGLSDGAEMMGTSDMIFTLVIWVVAIFLLWYTWNQAKAGVLN